MEALRVGIIGAGNVGSILGGRLANSSFLVEYGVRNVNSSKVRKLLEEQPLTKANSVLQVLKNSEVVILATPGGETTFGIVRDAEFKKHSTGKIIIDATNALSPYPDLTAFVWSGPSSSGEVIQKEIPEAFVFKAFNTIGAEHLSHPDGCLLANKVPRLTMLFCGTENQKGVVELIVRAVGFLPKYVGPIRYARNLEAIAELYIHLGLPDVGETKEYWTRNFHFQCIS